MSRPIAPKHRAHATGRPSSLRKDSRPSAVPRHRAGHPARSRRRTALLPAAALVGAAVAVTGSVAAGQPQDDSVQLSAQLAAANASAVTADSRTEVRADRSTRVSRSDRRPAVDRTKADRLTREAKSGGHRTRTRDATSQDPRTVARALLPRFGFSADEFSCLDSLWDRESGWDVHAQNPSSSAYGIPQALPGSKMASAGGDWGDNPATQIKWGLGYIQDRYGSPCGAWSHSESYGWY